MFVKKINNIILDNHCGTYNIIFLSIGIYVYIIIVDNTYYSHVNGVIYTCRRREREITLE